MHLPRITRRRLVAASAPAALAGFTLAAAQDATPSADRGPADSATPASIQQQVSDLATLPDITWPVSVASTFIVRSDNASIAQFSETAEKSCVEGFVAVVSAAVNTGANGTVTFGARDYACLNDAEGWGLMEPAIVQATAQSSEPAVVTASAEIAQSNFGPDAVITINSWDLNGQPLRDVWVNWMCSARVSVPQP
jgi:hypothetical protein